MATTSTRKVCQSDWLPVAVENIQGSPKGITAPPQKCWVEIEVLYAPLSNDFFFDVITYIQTWGEEKKYLTIDERKISINGTRPDSSGVDCVLLFHQMMESQNMQVNLVFTDQSDAPDVWIKHEI